MRRVWIARATAASILCLLAGCETMNLGGGSSRGESALPPRGQALPPPRPQGTKLTITDSDKGMTFQIKVGDRVSVSLVGTPTAGYQWVAVKPPAVLKEAGTLSGPTISDQLYPGFAGGNHWEVIAFDAVKTGSGKLKLEQRGPDPKEKPADTFTVSFEVIK
ncbi:MAG: protease inhibitor I42 family protein [Caulobacterales bacterium]